MNVIGQRIIEYLKSQSAINTALGAPNRIFGMGVQQRFEKYVTVSVNVGEDGNNIPKQDGVFRVECVVSRTVPNGFKICMDIAKLVDDSLNKREDLISTIGWKIINLTRNNNPSDIGLYVDEESNEFFYELEYSYILDETS